MNKITLETQKGAYSTMNESLQEALVSVLRAYGLKEEEEFKVEIKKKKDDSKK